MLSPFRQDQFRFYSQFRQPHVCPLGELRVNKSVIRSSQKDDWGEFRREIFCRVNPLIITVLNTARQVLPVLECQCQPGVSGFRNIRHRHGTWDDKPLGCNCCHGGRRFVINTVGEGLVDRWYHLSTGVRLIPELIIKIGSGVERSNCPRRVGKVSLNRGGLFKLLES